jgi:acetyltransferase-like isoleucine patch superfamily enzyme
MAQGTARRYVQRWRELHGRFGGLPSRLLLHAQFARREAAFKWPLHGNVLPLLREGRLDLGRDVILYEHVHLHGWPGAVVAIGEGTFFNRNVALVAIDRVEIGVHCLFGPGCFIADHDHDFEDHVSAVDEQGLTSRGPVRVGDHVWCGANVVITSGVKIGERSVIGANSVVTRDIPPYSVAVGAPARVVAANVSDPSAHRHDRFQSARPHVTVADAPSSQ